MTGANIKLTVDQQGVTVTGDNFRLTTTGITEPDSADDVFFGVAEAARMESIVSDLEAMTRRTYGQFCGISRALEVLGERWSMLIIRDLLVSAKTLGDLQDGLPRIPKDILASRLRELERAGVVRRSVGALSDEAVHHELTEFGAQLDRTLLALGRWGAQLLGEPRPEEIVTTDSLIMAMRSTFQRDAAAGVTVSYQVKVGDIVIHLRVVDGELSAGAGPLADADLSFEPGQALKELMSGELNAGPIIEAGDVPMTGDPELLRLFSRIFHIDAA